MQVRSRRPAFGVFCGSRHGTQPRFREEASRLGTAIGRRGAGLVYGGGTCGLMGVAAESAAAAGAHVIGVIPTHLLEDEAQCTHPAVHTFVVRSMHQRKALMYRLSAGFAVLPGGLGTFDELMEAATWNKLNLHKRPTVLINSGGFYDGLITFLDSVLDNGFISPQNRELIQVVDNAEDAVDLLVAQTAGPTTNNLPTGADSDHIAA